MVTEVIWFPSLKSFSISAESQISQSNQEFAYFACCADSRYKMGSLNSLAYLARDRKLCNSLLVPHNWWKLDTSLA